MCIYIWLYIYIWDYMSMYVYIYMSILCMYIYIYEYIMCIYIWLYYIYTCSRAWYIYIYMHIHMYRNGLDWTQVSLGQTPISLAQTSCKYLKWYALVYCICSIFFKPILLHLTYALERIITFRKLRNWWNWCTLSWLVSLSCKPLLPCMRQM